MPLLFILQVDFQFSAGKMNLSQPYNFINKSCSKRSVGILPYMAIRIFLDCYGNAMVFYCPINV